MFSDHLSLVFVLTLPTCPSPVLNDKDLIHACLGDIFCGTQESRGRVGGQSHNASRQPRDDDSHLRREKKNEVGVAIYAASFNVTVWSTSLPLCRRIPPPSHQSLALIPLLLSNLLIFHCSPLTDDHAFFSQKRPLSRLWMFWSVQSGVRERGRAWILMRLSPQRAAAAPAWVVA